MEPGGFERGSPHESRRGQPQQVPADGAVREAKRLGQLVGAEVQLRVGPQVRHHQLLDLPVSATGGSGRGHRM